IRIGGKYLLLVEIRTIQGKKVVGQSIVIHHRRLINLRNASMENYKARPHHQRPVVARSRNQVPPSARNSSLATASSPWPATTGYLPFPVFGNVWTSWRSLTLRVKWATGGGVLPPSHGSRKNELKEEYPEDIATRSQS